MLGIASKYWVFALMIALCSLSLSADAEQSAREIMDLADEQQRRAADSTLTKSSLSSCQFAVKNKKVSCTDTPRVKALESLTKQDGANKKDAQSISITLEPASERGIGMLTYSYDDSARDTESWLYLSALGKVKRMANGSGEDQEPVSIFGSEFTTEDMETGKTDEYTFKILQEGKYSGREVWVIEGIPKPVRLKKTDYSKLLYWIDKQRLVALKVQAYDKRGKLYKRMMFKKISQINGHWMARDVTIYNMKAQRLSNMKTDQVAMNVAFDPRFLTQRTLTDFAFREKELSTLRASFQ